MDKFYVVILWYSGGGAKPEVSFHPDADGAIDAVNRGKDFGQSVTVYSVADMPVLVSGIELRAEAVKS
jgi:hypothetical protein